MPALATLAQIHPFRAKVGSICLALPLSGCQAVSPQCMEEGRVSVRHITRVVKIA